MHIYHVFSLDSALLDLIQASSLGYGQRITALEKQMGQLTDAINALKASSDAEDASLQAALARVQADVAKFTQKDADMQAKIDQLQAQVDAGGASADDLKLLGDLKAQKDANKALLDALNPENPATLPSQAAAASRGPRRG